MSDSIRCPHCCSQNVKHSILGYGERAATYTAAVSARVVAGTFGSIFNNRYIGSAISRSIINHVPSEYICNNCGRKFHKSKNNI